MSLRPVMPIPLQTKLSIFEARNEYYSNWHLFARRWQHARGLHLAFTSIRPTLGTRSGAAPRIDIYSPGVGNTLGGFASHWYLFAWCWQHARGLRLALITIRPALATRLGATPYAINFSGLLNHQRRSVCYVDSGSTYSDSTTTSPTASIRQRHRLQQAFDNIITMIRPPCDSTDHDMQELYLVPSHATYKTTTSRRISD
jgi:hypothetical protein